MVLRIISIIWIIILTQLFIVVNNKAGRNVPAYNIGTIVVVILNIITLIVLSK